MLGPTHTLPSRLWDSQSSSSPPSDALLTHAGSRSTSRRAAKRKAAEPQDAAPEEQDSQPEAASPPRRRARRSSKPSPAAEIEVVPDDEQEEDAEQARLPASVMMLALYSCVHQQHWVLCCLASADWQPTCSALLVVRRPCISEQAAASLLAGASAYGPSRGVEAAE